MRKPFYADTIARNRTDIVMVLSPESWRDVKDVLAQALTLPKEARRAFLDAKCPSPEFRLEVETYLRLVSEAPDFLETVTIASALFGSPAAPAETLEPGSRVGRYIVIDQLGAGGMGEVFLVSDSQLHRKVALKRLFVGAAGATILHEARAAGRISHANVAAIYDVFEHDGEVFLVMEYAAGESLASYIRRARLPLFRVLAIGRDLASALTAAHANGILHGDLKPGNIQLTLEGSAKVLDFGVSQVLRAWKSERTSAARRPGAEGLLVHAGTPPYMSPEQILGRSIDHRSDIYSLGVVLFEMATGHRPYPGRDPFELVSALSRPIPRADDENPQLPPSVGDVIAKALAIDPTRRFQTAAELESALVELQRAYAPPSEAAVDLPRASKTWLLARALGVLALIPTLTFGGGWLSTLLFNRALGRVAPFDAESPDLIMATGMRSLVVPVLFMIVSLGLISAVRGAFGSLSRAGAVGRLVRRSGSRARLFVLRLSLNSATTAAKAMAIVGLCGIVGSVWLFRGLFRACLSPISSSPASVLLPLAPASGQRQLSNLTFDILVLVLSLGLIHVSQLRARHAARSGATAVTMLVIELVTAVCLMVLPYRLSFANRFPRVSYAGNRCYVIGQTKDDLLMFCADSDVPRNRIVKRSDQDVHWLGVVESLYTRR
jgi:hypothetical protein